MESIGRRFNQFLECGAWWHVEAFQFLKGRSRAISLHDYADERELIDAAPHQVIFLNGEKHADKLEKTSKPIRRSRSPWGLGRNLASPRPQRAAGPTSGYAVAGPEVVGQLPRSGLWDPAHETGSSSFRMARDSI